MSKATEVNENLRTDLLAVYLDATDGETTNVTKVTTDHGHINTRYAREILAVLSQGLLEQIEVDGADEFVITDWVQAQESDDFESARTMYTAEFDRWWTERTGQAAPATPKAKASKPKVTAVNADPNHKCTCGCAEPIGPKSMYKPGHDARHAGSVARDMAVADPTSWDSMMAELPTGALKTKAKAHALRLANKARVAQVKAGQKPAAPPTRDLDPIKVGRWEYPAREFNGITQRNAKRELSLRRQDKNRG